MLSGEILRWHSLQLILLNEATLVLVNDSEGLLDVICGLASQADLGEEILVLERVGSCEETQEGICQTKCKQPMMSPITL